MTRPCTSSSRALPSASRTTRVEFDLAAIAKIVRETEARRPSAHRRFRDVPIYAGESSRVLTWVDVFD